VWATPTREVGSDLLRHGAGARVESRSVNTQAWQARTPSLPIHLRSRLPQARFARMEALIEGLINSLNKTPPCRRDLRLAAPITHHIPHFCNAPVPHFSFARGALRHNPVVRVESAKWSRAFIRLRRFVSSSGIWHSDVLLQLSSAEPRRAHP
jgi:hypothetical protein